jgi:hypothetical protein
VTVEENALVSIALARLSHAHMHGTVDTNTYNHEMFALLGNADQESFPQWISRVSDVARLSSILAASMMTLIERELGKAPDDLLLYFRNVMLGIDLDEDGG